MSLLFSRTDRWLAALGGRGSRPARFARALARGYYAVRGLYQGFERRLIGRLPTALFYKTQQRYGWHFRHTYGQRALYETLRRHVHDPPLPSADRLRLAVVARPGTAHFLDPVLAALDPELEILVYPAYDRALLDHLGEIDVVWLEWGTAAFWLTELGAARGRSSSPRILCRLHDYELRSRHHLHRPAWDVADAIVFVNPDALETFDTATAGRWREKLVLVPNAIDELAFPLKTDYARTDVLLLSEGFTPRKNYRRAVRLFADAQAELPALRLVIRADPAHEGGDPLPVWRDIVHHGLEDKVVISVPTTPPRLRKQLLAGKLDVMQAYHRAGAILSTSDHEAFHYAVAEGMLSGLYPIVYPWGWGRPRALWGPYVADDDDDFVRRLVQWGRAPAERKRLLGEEARSWVAEHFGARPTRRHVVSLLGGQKKSRPRRRRILLLAHNHLHALQPHGGEKSMARIVGYLGEHGYETLVLVRNLKSRYTGRDLSDGLPTLCVQPAEFRTAAAEVLQWWRPDVVLTWELPAREAWDLCVGRGLPYVLFIRYWHLVSRPPYRDLLRDPIDAEHRELHAPVFHNAARVVVNAAHVGRVIERIYEVGSVVSYVPVAALPRLSPANSKRFVTLVNARKARGGELLRALAAHRPEREFLLVDSDDGRYPPNVVVRPYDGRPYNAMLDDTRVLLFPFDEEPCGTGRVVFEAYHLGVPVIGPQRGGLPEVIPAAHLVADNADVDAWLRVLDAIEADHAGAAREVELIVSRFDEIAQLEVIRRELEAVVTTRQTPRPPRHFGPPADRSFAVRADARGEPELIPRGAR